MVSENKITLEQMLLDLPSGRYDLVGTTRLWIEVLQRDDETKNFSQADLIKRALQDIISGKVSDEEVRKAVAKLKPMHGYEQKEKSEQAE